MTDIILSPTSHVRLHELSQINSTNRTARERVASGKRYQSVSENSIAIFQSARFRALANDLDHYRSNIQVVQNVLRESQNSLTSVTSVLQRITALVNNVQFPQGNAVRLAASTDQLRQYFKEIRSFVTSATGYDGTNILNSTNTIVHARVNSSQESVFTIDGFDLFGTTADRRLFVHAQGDEIFDTAGNSSTEGYQSGLCLESFPDCGLSEGISSNSISSP
ncbi:MAG: hypothetical protein AAF352_04530, partial [Pseudomonadota bacterium]